MAGTKKKRQARIARIKKRDGCRCWLCGERFSAKRRITIDHAIPKARGGTNEIHNLRLAHADCNHKRGAIVDTPRRAAQMRLAEMAFAINTELTHQPDRCPREREIAG